MCCAEVIFKIMQENKTIITLKLWNKLFLIRMIRFFTGQRTISVWNHLVWISWICLFLFGKKHPFRWSVIELNWINCKMFQGAAVRASTARNTQILHFFVYMSLQVFFIFFSWALFLKCSLCSQALFTKRIKWYK